MKETKIFWIDYHVKSRLCGLWKLYIGEYFNEDKRLWNRKKEPYIFYKHLYRQFACSKLQYKSHLRDVEQQLTGTRPHQSSIYHSVEQDPNSFKFTQSQLTEIIKFLNKYYDLSLNQMIKTKVMKAQNNGYTIDDIARNYLVHKEVIHNLLDNKKVPYHILKQMEKEL